MQYGDIEETFIIENESFEVPYERSFFEGMVRVKSHIYVARLEEFGRRIAGVYVPILTQW